MRSDIEKLRASARRMKKAFASGDAEAVRRLRAVVPEPAEPKHADFLHAVAREEGYESWPKLKFALETAEMSRAERAERLVRALYFGQQWIARKLIADDPAIRDGHFGLEVATYDLEAVRERLARNPSAATEKVGVRSPILHLAYSQYIHMAPARRADMLEIAALLVANGADVNDGYPPEPGSKHRISALYGALGHANNMALAEWLLERGANPDDNESLYHATELGHHDGLKLLVKFGVSPRGTNALPRALDFNDPGAVRLLLEHGADPNEAVKGHPSGQQVDTIPALHQAARRWCSAEIGHLLLDFGADASAVWQGHTPHATARMYGNAAMAEALEERGHGTPLSAAEEVLAACAAGVAPATRLRLSELSAEDRRLLVRLCWGPVPLGHLEALVAAGLDSNQPDEMGLTPLHVAGWEGLPGRVAYLLTLKPDLTCRNAYGGDALGATIHGSEFCPKAKERDHIGCARLLLQAGARLAPEDIDGCGREDMALFLESWNGG